MYEFNREAFAKYRKKSGLTQDDLAERLGINEGTVKYWTRKTNPSTPDEKMITKIAQILSVNPAELVILDDKFKKGITDKIVPSFRPFIGKASCGVPTTYYYEDVEMLPAPESSGKNAYYVEADGTSMSPRINDGDLIMCDPDVEVNSGDIVHFTWDGENGIKKYLNVGGTVMLQPINSEYPPIIVTDAYELNMVKCVRREEKL